MPEEDYEIEFGQAAVVREGQRRHRRRAGADGAPRAQTACETLAAEGIAVELIDPRTRRAARHGDHPGVGAQDRPAADRGRGFRAVRRGARSPPQLSPMRLRRSRRADPAAERRLRPTPYSPPLERTLVPDADAIAQAVKELMEE